MNNSCKCSMMSIETHSVVISMNAYDGIIDLEETLNYFSPVSELCTNTNCRQLRHTILKPMNHVIIELVSVPKGK